MKRYLLAALTVIAIAGPAEAVPCTNSFSFGTISAPALTGFGNGFGSVQQFSDCYNFTLDGSGSLLGTSWEIDASWMRNIHLSSITLSGGGLSSSITDFTPDSFSFGNLVSGNYQLIIAGDVSGWNGGFLGGGGVAYAGLIAMARAQAAPVPGPIVRAGLPGLAIIALGGMVAWRRRRIAAT